MMRTVPIDCGRRPFTVVASRRAIVAMRYALGLTSDEIGQAIGLSAPGVRSRLARCVAILRKDLADV